MAERAEIAVDRDGSARDRGRARAAWIASWVIVGVLAIRGVVRGLTDSYVKMDFRFFYDAALAVLEGTDIHLSGSAGYIYPPLLAVLMSPLALVGPGLANAVFTVLSAGLLMWSLWVLASQSVERLGVGRAGAPVWVIPGAVLIAVVALGDKIRAMFWMGQTDAITLAGIAGGLALLSPAPLAAGVVLGLAANVKYHTLLFLPYLLARRRWRASGGFALGAVGGALATVPIFGFDRNREYVETGFSSLLTLVGIDTGRWLDAMNPITWERSHSITSAAARLAEHQGLGTGAMAGMVAAVALAALALGWWILARHGFVLLAGAGVDRRDQGGRAIVLWEWAGLVVASLVFSPQTTGRHMVLLAGLVVPASVLMLTAEHGPRRVWTLIALVVGAVALVFPPGEMEALVWLWRAAGTASWIWLGAYLTILWVGVGHARTLGDRESSREGERFHHESDGSVRASHGSSDPGP